MADLYDTATQDHIKLVERINSCVDRIHQRLRVFEECIDPCTADDNSESQTKLMDLLEALEIIQEATVSIRPHNLDLRSKQQALEEQIECLEQTMDLLKLENGESIKSDKMEE